ncbi:MAG: TatD family hydrolase [Patescibacteria group bacterium]
MVPKFFDIHAHVNDSQYDGDRESVLLRTKEHLVWSIQVGTDHKTSQSAVAMATLADTGVYASIGVHPIDDRNERFVKEFFEELIKGKNIVAIGECGLDYSRLKEVSDIAFEKNRQRELFEQQIDFAISHDLPLMIHCRDSDKALADAHRDILTILSVRKEKCGDLLRGNIHFFSQTIAIAREYFALDFKISFTGVITFTHEYDEVIRLSPLERIMSETDCPYVTPVPHRGKRNEPIFVEEVVKKIAEIRNEDFETVREALVQNALRTFRISI